MLFLASKMKKYKQSKECINEQYKDDTDSGSIKLLSNGDGVVFNRGKVCILPLYNSKIMFNLFIRYLAIQILLKRLCNGDRLSFQKP